MEEYYEILDMVNKEHLNITKLYLLDCLREAFDNNGTEIDAVNYCYDLWLNANVDLDLGRLADIVADNWEDIQKDELTDTDIVEICLDI